LTVYIKPPWFFNPDFFSASFSQTKQDFPFPAISPSFRNYPSSLPFPHKFFTKRREVYAPEFGRRNPMRYTVTTFKVHLEVAEAGVPTRTAEDVWRFSDSIFRDLDADKEHFVLLALNNKNRINGYKVISTGTLTATLIRPADVYSAALHLAAAAVVFVHNHPSGDPMPSPEDQEITRRLKDCGEMLAIRVLDHVILGADRYYSFSDRGLL
jgi:DNA repair protein RadC